jgi:hypothetical protein
MPGVGSGTLISSLLLVSRGAKPRRVRNAPGLASMPRSGLGAEGGAALLGARPDYRGVEALAQVGVGFAGRNLAVFCPLCCGGGHRQRCEQTPPAGQLQEIVDGADDGPFGAHFFQAAQQELAEAARLFDLPEHRLGQLLA